MSLRIQLWGIRGSLPAPPRPNYIEEKFQKLLLNFETKHKTENINALDFLKSQSRGLSFGYGGHTSCVEVSSGDTQLIIDGGVWNTPLRGSTHS